MRSGAGQGAPGPDVLREMSLEACEDLGLDLLGEGEVPAALLCLREAMERGTKDPQVSKAYLNGMLYMLGQAELERREAKGEGPAPDRDLQEMYETLLILAEANARSWPLDPEHHLFHGMNLTALGRYREAVQAYDRGLELDGSDDGLHSARRLALNALGRG